jgi:hypothetical protein
LQEQRNAPAVRRSARRAHGHDGVVVVVPARPAARFALLSARCVVVVIINYV